MKWQTILTVFVLLAATDSQAAAKQNHDSVDWGMKNQEKRLREIEQEVSQRRSDIEDWYRNELNELRQSAEKRAKELLTDADRIFWIEFMRMNTHKPYADAYFINRSPEEYYFVRGPLLFDRKARELRKAMMDTYSIATTATFLMDPEAYEPVATIENNLNYPLLIRNKVPRILAIMRQLACELKDIQRRKEISLARLERWEDDEKAAVYREATRVKRQPAKPELGVVSAICHEPSAAFVMIEGIDENIVYEGDQISDIRVVKIYIDRVEFEKNGRKWVQKIGAKPDIQW
jgi:hypothetical protein